MNRSSSLLFFPQFDVLIFPFLQDHEGCKTLRTCTFASNKYTYKLKQTIGLSLNSSKILFPTRFSSGMDCYRLSFNPKNTYWKHLTHLRLCAPKCDVIDHNFSGLIHLQEFIMDGGDTWYSQTLLQFPISLETFVLISTDYHSTRSQTILSLLPLSLKTVAVLCSYLNPPFSKYQFNVSALTNLTLFITLYPQNYTRTNLDCFSIQEIIQSQRLPSDLNKRKEFLRICSYNKSWSSHNLGWVFPSWLQLLKTNVKEEEVVEIFSSLNLSYVSRKKYPQLQSLMKFLCLRYRDNPYVLSNLLKQILRNNNSYELYSICSNADFLSFLISLNTPISRILSSQLRMIRRQTIREAEEQKQELERDSVWLALVEFIRQMHYN